MPMGDTHERLDDAAPEPDQRILRSQDCCRRPAGTASGSDGSRSAAPASSLSSADTGKRPSESCLPPTHSPCVPSSGQCAASWPHGSRFPGTSPDPQRSPPVPAPGRAAPASPRAAAEPKGKSGTGSCSPPPPFSRAGHLRCGITFPVPQVPTSSISHNPMMIRHYGIIRLPSSSFSIYHYMGHLRVYLVSRKIRIVIRGGQDALSPTTSGAAY